MALSKTKGTKITGIVSIVPKKIEDNLELNLLNQQDREAIISNTGIRYRRIANNNQGVKELYQEGIQRLLNQLNWDKESIDILICVTQTTQISIPSVACQLHGVLNFSPETLCYDINSGCSGFVYGLHTISTLLSGIEKKNARAILCCGDISSQLISPDDKSVKPIFSDAVSIIGIETTEDKTTVSAYFNLQTDGSGQNAIYTEAASNNKQHMRLNGIDVFNYSLKTVPKNIIDLIEFADIDIDFPDLYVFHQANKIINDSISRKLKLNMEKIPSSLYEYGNTASASIPLTLGTIWDTTKINSNWILVSGFGVGFSVASALIYFEPEFCFVPIEIE